MGEIRSTLDIIMEKAKEVEVTDEDKAAFMEREIEGKVRGFLQKFLDGVLNTERFQSEMAGFEEKRHETAVSILKKECLAQMTLGSNNQPLLEILQDIAGIDTGPVEALISRYQEELTSKRAERQTLLKKRLADRGISGAAAVPNLEADPEWTAYTADLHDRLHQGLAAIERPS